MRLPKVDIQDHFKGNFHKEDKSEATTGDALQILNEAAISLTLERMQKDYQDAFGYVHGYTLIPKQYNHNPSKSCTINEIIDQECQHESIDVGFNQVKMVCKKCDKDL